MPQLIAVSNGKWSQEHIQQLSY